MLPWEVGSSANCSGARRGGCAQGTDRPLVFFFFFFFNQPWAITLSSQSGIFSTGFREESRQHWSPWIAWHRRNGVSTEITRVMYHTENLGYIMGLNIGLGKRAHLKHQSFLKKHTLCRNKNLFGPMLICQCISSRTTHNKSVFGVFFWLHFVMRLLFFVWIFFWNLCHIAIVRNTWISSCFPEWV